MPDFLSELNVSLLAATGVVCLLVLWWVATRAPGRWFAILTIGVLVAVGGVGIWVTQHNVAENGSAPDSRAAVDKQAAGQKKRQLQQDRATAEKRARAEAARKAEERIRREQAVEMERNRKAATEQAAARKVKEELEKRRVAAEREVRKAAELARKEAERARSVANGSPPSDDTPKSRSVTDKDTTKTQPTTTADNDNWHVVPVFFGTDRKREDGGKRLRYSADRGKRLEVGRALVTIPKIHKVPNIERPWVYRVPFLNIVIMKEKEDPQKHFTMQEIKHLSQDDFAALARARIAKSKEFEDQALVFVHGFNTTFDYAVYRVAQLSYDLKFDGGSFVYSWPSRGEVSPLGYSADRESAEQAAGYLEEFLTLIAEKSGAKSLTVIAHSMGNKLLLPVLQKLKLRNDTDVKISQVIFAAPDVDRDTFAGLAKEIQGLSKGGVTLYAASNDLALDASRRFWGGVARAGDVPTEGPLVVKGIDTIDVTETSTEIFSLNHAGYAQSKLLLNDIRSLMLDGYRPPKVRNGSLLQLTTPLGAYWKYP